jgi:hypothetical protein
MAKRGNPGYGKNLKIKENVDKFQDVFWELMKEFVLVQRTWTKNSLSF